MRFNQRSSVRHPGGGRLQIGIGGRLGSEQVAGFKSESVADFIPESVAGFLRNPQSCGLPYAFALSAHELAKATRL